MVVVEPGATAPLTIEVENIGTANDEVEVGIDGIDGEWTAIPVPIIKLKPGEKQSVKIFFKPPRASESIAGNYPFVAKIRSLNDGDTRTAQGVLTIKPYFTITLEVTPKKGFVSPTKRQNIFTVTLTNMGNSEHMIQLTADDPEDVCTYEFDEEQVVLAPGQQRDIDFLVNPKKSSPFGSTRLIGFAVTGRSLSNQGVVASSQGQLEIRPLFTPLNTFFLAATIIILTILALNQPKQPTAHVEQVTKTKVVRGGTVLIHWSSSNAQSVRIVAAGETVKDNLAPEGEIEIQTPLVGTLKIQAIATRDKRRGESEILDVKVEEPVVIPEPEIVQLAPSKYTINKGEKFTLNYKFLNTTKAILSPENKELNLTFNSSFVDAGEVGETTYTVAAYNSIGKSVTKSFTIKVIDPCLAKIVRFDVVPMEVEPIDGKVTLTWQVATAVRIELTYTGTKETFTLDPVGSREFPIIGKTTFTIKATDATGKTVSVSKVVTIKQPPIPPDNNVSPATSTGGAGGTTTGL